MAGPPPALGRSGSANKDKAAMLAADDAKRMQALESKVTAQKKELENRDITIRAIQRNFEQLSSMCQADKEQITALQKKLAEAEKRTVSAEEREQAAKYPKLKDAFDALNNMYVETEDKMAKLQKQLAAALGNSDKGDADRKALLAQIQEGKKALEECQRKLADAERAASGWDSKRTAMDQKLQELQDAVKAKEKMRADLEKSETTLRSEMSRLQAQMMKADQACR
jgi:chromosome segregation ATPase